MAYNLHSHEDLHNAFHNSDSNSTEVVMQKGRQVDGKNIRICVIIVNVVEHGGIKYELTE